MDKPHENLVTFFKDDAFNDNSGYETLDKEHPFCELNHIQVAGKDCTLCYANEDYEKLGERTGTKERNTESSGSAAIRQTFPPPPYQSAKVAADPADRCQPAHRSTRCILFVIAMVALGMLLITVGVIIGFVAINKGGSDPDNVSTTMTTDIYQRTPQSVQTTKESLPTTRVPSTSITDVSASSSTSYANVWSTNAASFKGEWSNWSSWNNCDKTCGPGTHIRSRHCLHQPCFGRDSQLETCYVADCPSPADEYAKWTTWGPWSLCSVSCGDDDGNALQTRSRSCQILGELKPCIGIAAQTRGCNEGQCPDCGVLVCDNGNVECLKCRCPGKILSGKVLTAEGAPLQFVKISFEEFGHAVLDTTDMDGKFILIDICPGDDLQFTKEGYVANTTSLTHDNHLIRLSRIEHLYITQEPMSAASMIGGCVQLECEAKGSPGPTYYEWYHDDVLILNAKESKLVLSDISKTQTGRYKCRANNDYTAVFSRTVTVNVEATESEFCDTTPRSNLQNLPYGCEINGDRYVDVGTCASTKCALESEGSCEEFPQLSFCGVISYAKQMIQCTHYIYPVDVVTQCGCLAALRTRRFRGQVLEKITNKPILFANIVMNGADELTSLGQGFFTYDIPVTVNRLTIDIEHSGNYFSSSSVIAVSEGSISIDETFYLTTKPAPMIFSSSGDIDILVSSDDNIQAFTAIELPPNSLFDTDGKQHDGEVKAFVEFYDSRDPLSFENAPSDFTTLDVEGEAMMLESGGMFRIDFTDTLNNPLNIGSNMTISYTINTTDVAVANRMKLWTLDDHGRWEFVGNLTIDNRTISRRKRQIDDNTWALELFTENIPGVIVNRRWINFDYISEYICYSKVHIYDHDTLTRSYNNNAKVQVVTLAGEGAAITTVRERFAWGGELCIDHPCDTTRNNENTNYRGYVLARYGNHFFKPISNPNMFSTFDAQIVGDKILSDFSYRESTKGPFYDYGSNFQYSSKCENAPLTDWSFQFYDKVETDCQTVETSRMDTFSPTNPLLRYFFYSSEHINEANEVCFMRVKITTGYTSQIVLTSRSYTENSTTIPSPDDLYGTRQECVENQEYICIEYKAPGNVYPTTDNERTRVIVHMEGKYDIRQVISQIAEHHTVIIDQSTVTANIMLQHEKGVEGFTGRYCNHYNKDVNTVKQDIRVICENEIHPDIWALHFK